MRWDWPTAFLPIMSPSCYWGNSSRGGPKVEGGGEWKRRCINSAEINRKARKACLENPLFPLWDPTRTPCFLRFVVCVLVCDGFETNALCCREKKKKLNVFDWQYGGWHGGGSGVEEEAIVEPQPGFLFLVFLVRGPLLRTEAERSAADRTLWFWTVFMLNSAVWILRLHCRPECQSGNRPDKIVFQMKQLEKLCQCTF